MVGGMSSDPDGIGFGPQFTTPVLLGPALNPVNTTMTAVALGVLVRWGLRAEAPLIDVRMLAHNGALSCTYLRMFLTYTGMHLMVYGATRWLQDAAGYFADHAGLIQLATCRPGSSSRPVGRHWFSRSPTRH